MYRRVVVKLANCYNAARSCASCSSSSESVSVSPSPLNWTQVPQVAVLLLKTELHLHWHLFFHGCRSYGTVHSYEKGVVSRGGLYILLCQICVAFSRNHFVGLGHLGHSLTAPASSEPTNTRVVKRTTVFYGCIDAENTSTAAVCSLC